MKKAHEKKEKHSKGKKVEGRIGKAVHKKSK